MARTSALLLALATCLLMQTVHADENAGAKVKGWGEVIDPDHDCKITVAEGKVTFELPGTAHDYAAELQRWNAPRILGSATGDFIMEVKVSGTFKPSDPSTIATRRAYNGTGLLLIKDDKNYINLHRGAVFLDDMVRQYANFELRKDGEMSISRYEVDLEDRDTWLRLERRGSKVFGMASHDGVNWKAYDEPITIDFPETVQVGVEARNSSSQPFISTLEGFTVFQKVADR